MQDERVQSDEYYALRVAEDARSLRFGRDDRKKPRVLLPALAILALENPSIFAILMPPRKKEFSMHSNLVIGKRFPDLTLPDHRQQPIRLSELAGGFPLILSFYRGYW